MRMSPPHLPHSHHTKTLNSLRSPVLRVRWIFYDWTQTWQSFAVYMLGTSNQLVYAAWLVVHCMANLFFYYFYFLLGIFLIYLSNAIPKVPHTPPTPLPTHSHFLALAFPCMGSFIFKKQLYELFSPGFNINYMQFIIFRTTRKSNNQVHISSVVASDKHIIYHVTHSNFHFSNPI